MLYVNVTTLITYNSHNINMKYYKFISEVSGHKPSGNFNGKEHYFSFLR